MTAMYEWLDVNIKPQLGLLDQWISEQEIKQFVEFGVILLNNGSISIGF